MKNLVCTILILTLTTTFLHAQKIDFGAKAGINYNFAGDLSEVISETGNNFENLIAGADNKAGFHVGLWSKINLIGLYVRPEVNYTVLNNSYNNASENINTDFKTKKVDVPILIGAKLLGPLHIFGGPALQYISNSEFTQSGFENIRTQDLSVGLQLGAGLDLGRLGVDVRWEKGFSNDLDGEFLNTNIKVDNRPNQIIFGLSYRFNDRNK